MVGALQLSPTDLGNVVMRRIAVVQTALESDLWTRRGLVGTEPGKGAASVVAIPDAAEGTTEFVKNENMHLTLMLRMGWIGWVLMMWIIAAALRGMYAAMAAVSDRRLALTLWAVFSSAVGFLVSMSNFNAFYNPTIQIVFWGLLGLGTAIATHAGGRRPTFNVVYRFGQGD
jgi:hypothetical protein